MKNIYFFICFFTFSSLSFADTTGIRTDCATTSLGVSLGKSSPTAVDSAGRVCAAPASSTSSIAIKGAPTSTQPSVTTATSTTCLAANANRNYFSIQNNTAANIMINLSGATLSGIAPSNTNPGIVLTPGDTYESAPNYVSTSAITCYQTSGGTVTSISVIEG